MLDDAASAREWNAPGKGAREDPEWSVVVAAHNQQVVPAAALGLGLEAQLRSVGAADARQVRREGDGLDLVRPAGDPYRTLAAAGGVVDAADQIPCDAHAIVTLAD